MTGSDYHGLAVTPTRRSDAATDLNGAAAAALRDMAALQDTVHGRRAYAQAATAVLGLDVSLDRLQHRDGTLPRLPGIGPSSTRVLREVLDHGTSPTVERLIDQRRQRAAIDALRALRHGFLSRAAAREVLALAGADLQARYQGDLQMHSTWSDGQESVHVMAEGCRTRGYAFCAMTDHAGGLPIAGGLSAERLAAQAGEIARVNRDFAGAFHVFAGVEANLTPEGGLDVSAEQRLALDLVVAAPHSGLRTATPQTARLLAAVATPGVHILGHPRGRKYGTRAGIAADWPRVFAAAAASGVAIELDGDPSRQDLDCTLAVQAREAGCLFALDSDAHAVSQLWYTELAMAHALLAGIPVDRIVNCWPLDRFRAWLDARRHGAAG